jgi:4-hydroxythreonine-4-phosphate dehydrogenase
MLPLAISLGDLGGIGPEVTLKALSRLRLPRPVVLYGDAGVVARTKAHLGLRLAIRAGAPGARGIYLHALTNLPAKAVKPGNPSDDAARSTLAHLTAAVDDVRAGRRAALVTAPIQKERLAKIGFAFPGHTEFLAHRTGAKHFAMMLAGDKLKVVLVTIHCALAEVPRRITRGAVLEKIELTRDCVQRWFGKSRPRIAVLGLNPHAGENGIFGDEEGRVITPAIRAARARGWKVEGPFPADGFFGHQAGDYDAVVCMYHDQGLIPLKLLHFWNGVNVTLGLPIIRTSPDHGTAYDIAGRGAADARSMAQAIRWADAFARREGR